MKMMTNLAQKNGFEGDAIHIMRENNPIGRPMPPHKRKALMHIVFDENDWKLFQMVYEDDDEAAAAMQVIMNAPPEIQILMAQLIDLYQEVA